MREILVSSLFLLACGQVDTPDDPSASPRPFIQIPISVNESINLLESASAFSMTLDSCVSGLTSTIDENSGTISVYEHDRDCLVKLTSFTVNSKTYVPSSGDPFTTWQAGDIATFEESGTPSNTRRVEVVSTLSSPVDNGDSISYAFSKLVMGTGVGSLLQVSMTGSATLEDGGQSAPSFSVYQTNFNGLAAGNAAEFVFTLECSVALVSDSCDGLDLGLIRYKLVEDTYSSSLNLSEADALFPAGEQSIDIGTEKLAPGAGGTTNGGFITKTLESPGSIEQKPNMILILQANDESYQYFNLDIAISTSP